MTQPYDNVFFNEIAAPRVPLSFVGQAAFNRLQSRGIRQGFISPHSVFMGGGVTPLEALQRHVEAEKQQQATRAAALQSIPTFQTIARSVYNLADREYPESMDEAIASNMATFGPTLLTLGSQIPQVRALLDAASEQRINPALAQIGVANLRNRYDPVTGMPVVSAASSGSLANALVSRMRAEPSIGAPRAHHGFEGRQILQMHQTAQRMGFAPPLNRVRNMLGDSKFQRQLASGQIDPTSFADSRAFQTMQSMRENHGIENIEQLNAVLQGEGTPDAIVAAAGESQRIQRILRQNQIEQSAAERSMELVAEAYEDSVNAVQPIELRGAGRSLDKIKESLARDSLEVVGGSGGLEWVIPGSAAVKGGALASRLLGGAGIAEGVFAEDPNFVPPGRSETLSNIFFPRTGEAPGEWRSAAGMSRSERARAMYDAFGDDGVDLNKLVESEDPRGAALASQMLLEVVSAKMTGDIIRKVEANPVAGNTILSLSDDLRLLRAGDLDEYNNPPFSEDPGSLPFSHMSVEKQTEILSEILGITPDELRQEAAGGVGVSAVLNPTMEQAARAMAPATPFYSGEDTYNAAPDVARQQNEYHAYAVTAAEREIEAQELAQTLENIAHDDDVLDTITAQLEGAAADAMEATERKLLGPLAAVRDIMRDPQLTENVDALMEVLQDITDHNIHQYSGGDLATMLRRAQAAGDAIGYNAQELRQVMSFSHDIAAKAGRVGGGMDVMTNIAQQKQMLDRDFAVGMKNIFGMQTTDQMAAQRAMLSLDVQASAEGSFAATVMQLNDAGLITFDPNDPDSVQLQRYLRELETGHISPSTAAWLARTPVATRMESLAAMANADVSHIRAFMDDALGREKVFQDNPQVASALTAASDMDYLRTNIRVNLENEFGTGDSEAMTTAIESVLNDITVTEISDENTAEHINRRLINSLRSQGVDNPELLAHALKASVSRSLNMPLESFIITSSRAAANQQALISRRTDVMADVQGVLGDMRFTPSALQSLVNSVLDGDEIDLATVASQGLGLNTDDRLFTQLQQMSESHVAKVDRDLKAARQNLAAATTPKDKAAAQERVDMLETLKADIPAMLLANVPELVEAIEAADNGSLSDSAKQVLNLVPAVSSDSADSSDATGDEEETGILASLQGKFTEISDSFKEQATSMQTVAATLGPLIDGVGLWQDNMSTISESLATSVGEALSGIKSIEMSNVTITVGDAAIVQNSDAVARIEDTRVSRQAVS